jgi:hypothetical protein
MRRRDRGYMSTRTDDDLGRAKGRRRAQVRAEVLAAADVGEHDVERLTRLRGRGAHVAGTTQ